MKNTRTSKIIFGWLQKNKEVGAHQKKIKMNNNLFAVMEEVNTERSWTHEVGKIKNSVLTSICFLWNIYFFTRFCNMKSL